MGHGFGWTVLRRAGAALVLAALALPPCLAQGLTVAADSSLAGAMQAVARGFEASHPGARVSLLSGASGALLERIAQGAPVDVLASADAQTVREGVQRHLLRAEAGSAFALNALVLVVPAKSNGVVQRLSDLARPEVLRVAMGRESSVAAGRSAREAINAQRLWPAMQRKLVLADDAQQVLALVANADVEAGFVYATDVSGAAVPVRVVETLATTTPIRHLAHVVSASEHPALAGEFVAYLRSEPARAVFRRLGFGLP